MRKPVLLAFFFDFSLIPRYTVQMLTAVRGERVSMDAINELIQTRMKKNLTLEQVAQDAKIPIRYLKAIEDYQLDKLPKSNLSMMFLRRYAEYLDLSPDPILKLFDELEENDKSNARASQSSVPNEEKSETVHWKKWLWYGVPLAVIVMVGVGWLLVSHFFSDQKGANVEDTSTQTTEQKQVSTVTFPTAKDRAKLELIEPIELNNKYDRFRLSNVNKIELVVTAKNKPTTIEVGLHQQNQPEQKNLSANEKVQFSDQQAISLRINQPSQVHVSVNGITVEPTHPTKQASYRFELQAGEN